MARRADVGQPLVPPGIVTCTATLNATMLAPVSSFPYDSALFDVDRQLLANGITTEFHGATRPGKAGCVARLHAVNGCSMRWSACSR